MAFHPRPFPQPSMKRVFFPPRAFGAERREQETQAFIDTMIVSDMKYSFMDNILTMAEQACKDRVCHHEAEEAEVGSDRCAICIQNWTYDMGSELWSWFKLEFSYLFEGSRGKKDLIKELRGTIARLEEKVTEQADIIADLKFKLDVERGAANFTPQEEKEWRILNNQGAYHSIYHKNLALQEDAKRFERSRNWWKEAHAKQMVINNNAFSKLKLLENAMATTRGEQGPLLNCLTNLVLEVEMLSASIGGLVMDKEISALGDDVVVTHAIDPKGSLDRYLMAPHEKTNMSVYRTEKAVEGRGETHLVVRGCYGLPRAPWGDSPLKSRHMLASSQEMEELQSQMRKLAETVRGTNPAARSAPPPPFGPKRPRLPSSVSIPHASPMFRPQLPRGPPHRPPLPTMAPPLPPTPPPSATPANAAGQYRGTFDEIESTTTVELM